MTLTSKTLFGYLFVACLVLILLGCQSGEPAYSPKPKGYNRIALPPHRYVALSEEHPYQFEISKWAVVLPDTFAVAEPHWIFIHYPKLNANIQLTYKPTLNNPKKLSDHIEDAYKLAAKHQIRALAIQEQTIRTQSGQAATLFRIEGDVASQFQFYTTDTTQHFLRGAVYLSSATQNDSLAPVIDYLKQDALHLLNTLRWRK